MKWRAPLVVGHFLIFVACASASNSGSPTAPGSVKLNQSFTLKVSASESIEGENAQIGFDSVLSDSRCPKGAQCIVAGDATIRVWLARSSQPRQTRDLKTSPPDATQAVISPYRVTLTSLAPEPTVDGTPRASDYVATLVVAREP
jgi:hypothetical protein